MRFTLFLFVFVPTFVFSQQTKMDTINLLAVKSNYPLIAKCDDLRFIDDVKKWHYCYNVKGQQYPSRSSDTFFVYYANQIYADNYKLSFLETNGTIRLEYIWLEKNKKFWINYDGLVLCNNTSLDVVNQFFKNDSGEATYGIGPIMRGNKFKNLPHYILSFSTGEPNNTRMTLFFDYRKRLKIIQIDYYHPCNLIMEVY